MTKQQHCQHQGLLLITRWEDNVQKRLFPCKWTPSSVLSHNKKKLRYVSILCASSTLPDSEKGDKLFPLLPPFSLLLTDEDELGLGVKALLENCRVFPSEKTRTCIKTWSHARRSGSGKMKMWTSHWKGNALEGFLLLFHLSSRWGVLYTEHPVNSSPGSILSASAFWAAWITSGWYGLKTRWSIGNLSPRSRRSFLKNLPRKTKQNNIIVI